jgi:hypothetical protein
VINRWKQYFEGSLNDELPREAIDRVEWNLGMVDLIREEEVWNAVRKIKNKKAVGPDRIPVDVWKLLESLGIKLLCQQWSLYFV